MSDLMKAVNKLCLPAQTYLAISTLSILAVLFQNIGKKNMYCIGTLQTSLPCNNMTVFLFKVLYMVVVTWILQKLCKKGHSNISWLLVLLPYISMFLFSILLVLYFSQHPTLM